MQRKQNTQRKLLFLGDSGVGKTSLIYQMLHSSFDKEIQPTIGAAYFTYQYEKNCRLAIWDMAGAERFRNLLPMYLRKLSAIVFMYDASDFTSLEKLKRWKQLIDPLPKKPTMLLLGTKSDLLDQNQIEICKQKAQIFASENQMGFCGLASATEDQCDLLNTLWEKAGPLIQQPNGYGKVTTKTWGQNKSVFKTILKWLKFFFKHIKQRITEWISKPKQKKQIKESTEGIFCCIGGRKACSVAPTEAVIPTKVVIPARSCRPERSEGSQPVLLPLATRR